MTTNLVPPQAMLYDGSSSEADFVRLGEEFCQQVLIPRGGLVPNAAILDLGCGNGSIARPLTRFLSPDGRYEGLDVNRESIAWLRGRYRPYPNFRFQHVDISNEAYNPSSGSSASAFRLPFGDGSFDVVLLKSVFTHMLPADVRAYLREIGRVLKRGGRSVITYFLLNDESRRFIKAGGGPVSMEFEYGGDPLSRVMRRDLPEASVAHDESRIRLFYRESGCTPVELDFGNWCGRPSSLGLQDLIVAMKD